MKIHYFQRYHSKENVATANTMLLLSRFYSFSSDRFFRFLKSEFFSDAFEPEIVFNLQEKSIESIPDATITQESFKIIVETKMSDWFYANQIMNHLKGFDDVKYKVLITLAPELMNSEKKKDIGKEIEQFNANQQYPVIHINTTFDGIIKAIREFLNENDYEMHEVLDDYMNYCFHDNLIISPDSWKWMRVQLARTTFDFNVKENVYYDNVARGFSAHDYLGLYKEKSVRAIGKISAIVVSETLENGTETYKTEFGNYTSEMKLRIDKAIHDGRKYGYTMTNLRYFFVDKFYETDFKKVTPRAPMGTRFFDLSKILEADQLPAIKDIANILRAKTWE